MGLAGLKVSKSRESEFPPTEERSVVSKSRESEFPPTEDGN